MFDPRDDRMPRSIDREYEDFVIEVLTRDKDPLGVLRHLDDTVSEGRYSNRDFSDLLEKSFAIADALVESRAVRSAGEAVRSALLIIASDCALTEKARFLDKLDDRDYNAVRDMGENYIRIMDALDDRGRGRDRGRSRDDRGRGRDRDERGRGRRQHPDDIRAERQRDARREEEERRRTSRRDDRRDERRDDRRDSRDSQRDEPRRDSRRKELTPAQRKVELGKLDLELFQYMDSQGRPEDIPTEDDVIAAGIDLELYKYVGGQVAAASAKKEVAPQPDRGFQETAHTRVDEPQRTNRRLEAERASRQSQQPVTLEVEPPAFAEVFNAADQEPVVAKTRASDPIPENAELVAPTISPDIDYNANITTLGVNYASGEERPDWDPIVPTLQQWKDAGFDVEDPLFVNFLPELPAVRGFMPHATPLFDPTQWVPQWVTTPDGYKMQGFRQRDMNKDDILIPNVGKLARKNHIPHPFDEAVNNTTRYNPLAVAAEQHAAVQRYDADKKEWVDTGSQGAEPVQEVVDTQRHGQLMEIPSTIVTTTLSDAAARMYAYASTVGVGLDTLANISANVKVVRLMGPCQTDEQFEQTKTALEMFIHGGNGEHMGVIQLWRTFMEAQNVVPFHIWHKLEAQLTAVLNEVLQDRMGLPLAIKSFAAEAGDLVDIITGVGGRYLAEVFVAHSALVSYMLRGVMVETPADAINVARGIWFVTPRRVVLANATLKELGLAATDTPKLDVGIDVAEHFSVQPKQNPTLTRIADRLLGEVHNSMTVGHDRRDDACIELITLDDYRCTISQNWLSKDLYLSMAVRKV